MKLTVIGATGGTGSHLVSQAVREGHEITAFTRRPELLSGTATVVRVVQGNGRDGEAIREAVADADVVVAIVKPSSPRGPFDNAAVARVLVEQMTTLGVKRLVMTSAYPIVAKKPRLPMFILRTILREGYNDVRQMEQILKASDLDWTIARMFGLHDKPATGNVTVSRSLFDRPATLAREDAASAILSIATDEGYTRTAVNVAGAATGRRRRPQ